MMDGVSRQVMALQYLSWLCYMRRAVPRSATVAGIAKRCSEIPELVLTLVVFVFTCLRSEQDF